THPQMLKNKHSYFFHSFKTNYYRTIGVLLLMLTSTGNILAQNIQQKSWLLDNQILDFSSGTPAIINNVPGNSTGGVANSMHDAQGDFLFYVENNKVVNKFGSLIGNLSWYTAHSINEMCIIPVPESTCRYYLVSGEYIHDSHPECGLSTYISTWYATIDMSQNNVSGTGVLVNTGTEIEYCNTYIGQYVVGPIVAIYTNRF